MAQKLSVRVEKKIFAPISKVWRALTDPAQIKVYLFGTDTQSEWKKGGPITYKGEWQGKPYEDKGTIVEIIPDRLLHTTYYSSMSGKPDLPENYANVIYELQPDGPNTTLLILTQDNIDNADGVAHMEQNWNLVLDKLKALVEKSDKVQ